ncbi:MAG: hypothetical protein EB038_10350 [Cyclobacteriaceae bacterium]|nr:hypothetical protein [Cyclobacteriaceae bacterium]
MENKTWINYDPIRNEWIDSDGVGHYDTSNKFTEHGCNGACTQEDFPGRNKTRQEAILKAKSLGFTRGTNEYLRF